jgi:hypothetical protein
MSALIAVKAIITRDKRGWKIEKHRSETERGGRGERR